jgi:hypothetical protein
VNNSGHPTACDEVEEHLLDYLEDRLAPERRASVDEHLRSCPECSAKLEGLPDTVRAMRNAREAFCPKTWELYEYVLYEHDPQGRIAAHTRRCDSCRELCESLTGDAGSEPMPASLWDRIRDQLPQHGGKRLHPHGPSMSPIEQLFGRLRFPALAAGAAMAAVLLVVLLYPKDKPYVPIALSSVTWQGVPKPKSFGPSRHRAAILLVLKDFPAALPQKKVDAFYQALAPTMELYKRFQIVSPAELTDAIEEGQVRADSRKAVLRSLHKKLGVSTAVVVTLMPRGGGMRIRSELIDTASGAVRAEETVEQVADAYVPSKIRQAVFRLLGSHGKGGGNRRHEQRAVAPDEPPNR